MPNRMIDNISVTREVLDALINSQSLTVVPDTTGHTLRLADGKTQVQMTLNANFKVEMAHSLQVFTPTDGFIITAPKTDGRAVYWLSPQHSSLLQTFTSGEKRRLKGGDTLEFVVVAPRCQAYDLRHKLRIRQGTLNAGWWLVLDVNEADEKLVLNAYSNSEFQKRFRIL